MCKDCGCSLPNEHVHHHDHGHRHDHDSLHQNPQLNDPKTLEAIGKILSVNDKEASKIRSHFDQKKILGVNMMSSPGAGKTSLLEKSAALATFKFSVVEGDLQTSRDADRLKALGVQAYQITTGTACHLDAHMVHHALHHLDLEGMEVVFVENVGNLVCPASYDVGTHLNVVLLSVPEGDDKVGKYPTMFKVADLVIITKCDLLEYFDFDVERVKKEARALNPKVEIMQLSTKDDNSMKAWMEYLTMKRKLMV